MIENIKKNHKPQKVAELTSACFMGGNQMVKCEPRQG